MYQNPSCPRAGGGPEPSNVPPATLAPRLRGGTGGASDSGFTLIELIVSLSLFALIAVAGLALVDSVLGVQGRTDVRLDRLTDLQRAMLVVQGDLEQVAAGDVRGGGAELTFTRAAPGLGGPPVAITYRLARGVLTRSAGGGTQALLRGVAGVRWRFFADGWVDRWPVTDAPDWPRAVEMELTVAGQGASGSLRRVVRMPVRARVVT